MTQEQQQQFDILELQKKQLEIEKLQLEKSKIQLETKEISKPWYNKHIWWQTIVTLVISAVGVYVAFSTNIIGLQEKKTEISRLDTLLKQKNDSMRVASLLIQHQEYSIQKSKEEKRSYSFLYAAQIQNLSKIEAETKNRIIIQQNAIAKQSNNLKRLESFSDSLAIQMFSDSLVKVETFYLDEAHHYHDLWSKTKDTAVARQREFVFNSFMDQYELRRFKRDSLIKDFAKKLKGKRNKKL